MKRFYLVAVFACAASGPALAELPADPLKSSMWTILAKRYFSEAPVVFDERVKIVVPSITENQAQVPVAADARAVPGVTKMIVFADLNPIQHVLTLTPQNAAPYISFRMKVEQATPVRAAALTEDGVWHVGGVFLEAAGGGCTANAMARNDTDWADTLGQTQGKTWRELDGTTRARIRIKHPMDTGLAKDNTPSYHIETLNLHGSSGEPLAIVETFEPVSEDPTMTLMLHVPPSDASIEIDGLDNNGGTYRSSLPVPGRQSSTPSPETSAGLG